MELAYMPILCRLISYVEQNHSSIPDVTGGDRQRDCTNMLADRHVFGSCASIDRRGQHAFGNGGFTRRRSGGDFAQWLAAAGIASDRPAERNNPANNSATRRVPRTRILE